MDFATFCISHNINPVHLSIAIVIGCLVALSVVLLWFKHNLNTPSGHQGGRFSKDKVKSDDSACWKN